MKTRLKDFITEFIYHVEAAQLFTVASSLAFMTILSIIPLLAVSFAIFDTFGGMEKLYQQIEPLILSNLATASGTDVISKIHKMIDQLHVAALGGTGVFALILTTISMLFSIEKAINRVWQTKITRKPFFRIATYWFFITLGPLTLSIAIGLAPSRDFPLTYFLPTGSRFFIVAVAVLYSLYKWVPQVIVKPFFALLSALITAILWYLARIVYITYIHHVLTYKTIYGSLSAIPVLLIWIDIGWILILMGAALNATLQKQLSNVTKMT